MIIDAHTHLQLIPKKFWKSIESRIIQHGIICVSCATQPADWQELLDLCENSAVKIFPQFGIHPWFVSAASKAWKEELRDVLARYPQAGIGEIGLDYHRFTKNSAESMAGLEIFEEQLNIAEELNRPVTVHCVKAHDSLLGILKIRRISVPVVLHSYSGNIQQTEAYLKLQTDLYFSFNCRHNRDNVLRLVPESRLLIETDSPDQAPTAALISPGINDPTQLLSLIDRVARVRNLSTQRVIEITGENAKRAFRLKIES